MYRAHFSVLTGGAGTGKTTVLRAFVQGIRSKQKGHSIACLAPTGKAAVLLSDRVGLPAETVHHFLASHKWIAVRTFVCSALGANARPFTRR